MLIWRTAAWPGVRRPGLPRPERGADAGPAAPLRRLLPTTLGYAQGLLPPSAWNGSWDDARIIPAQLVPSVRLPVLSVQLHRLQVRGDKHRDIDLGLGASARSFYYVVRGGQRVRKDTKTHQDRWLAIDPDTCALIATYLDETSAAPRAGIHPLAGRIGQVGACRANEGAPAPDGARAPSYARVPARGGIRRQTLLRAIRHECARQRP